MPDWVRDGMVPCLGGLRAFAIVCVLVSHFYDFPGNWRVGHFGVISFFVISGFLITLLLLRERRRTGKIALGAFFQRRALRILPAYCLLMLVFYGFQLVSIHRISNDTWLAMLTFTQCFVMPTMDPFLNHTWSIAVEEHFYLLWPFLFLRLSLRTVALVLTLFLALSPALRWALLQSSSPVIRHPLLVAGRNVLHRSWLCACAGCYGRLWHKNEIILPSAWRLFGSLCRSIRNIVGILALGQNAFVSHGRSTSICRIWCWLAVCCSTLTW